ncbi:MAG TPA: tRNA pseudouridine(38-40) synthase TruA [Chitinophagales bacterium]|nr:tRNA pseudouridine(38-40) synthase TruA [Chitinophagales bacterium]
MRYFIQLSYHGKKYCGWQRQENAVSVQELLEDNLSKLLSEKIEIIGCGRTDAGVHAKDYYAHFELENPIPENFLYRINRMLPEDIAVLTIFEVKPNFHARFDATKRTYKYFIHYEKNPFLENQSFLWNQQPTIAKMNHCIQQLLGEHDFSTFEKKGSDNKTSICKLEYAQWEETENGLVFTITANRFLRNMVRRITAALLMVGLGKLDEQEIINAVIHKLPLEVRMAVPAKGLFLWKIEYDF